MGWVLLLLVGIAIAVIVIRARSSRQVQPEVSAVEETAASASANPAADQTETAGSPVAPPQPDAAPSQPLP
jgi:hypothetical protein